MDSAATVVRSSTRYWVTLLFAVIWGGYCVIYGVMLGLGEASAVPGVPTVADRTGDGLVDLAFGVWAWAIWWTLGRCYVAADRYGVTIRNVVRPVFLPWDDVAGFEAVRGRQFAYLRLSSGDRRVLMAVGGVRLRRMGPTRAQQQVARLEARRPGPADPSPSPQVV